MLPGDITDPKDRYSDTISDNKLSETSDDDEISHRVISSHPNLSNLYIADQGKDFEADGTHNGVSDMSEAPDGGWGWVIVVASFCIYFTVGFMFGAFPVLYVALVEYFQTGRGITGWISSLYNCTGNILGLVIGVVIKQYGCKTVCWCGVIINVVGVGLSSLLISVPYVCFTLGILGGIGNATVAIPALVMLQTYFNKKRNIAMGLATSGMSVGGLVSTPCTNQLLKVYGLSGTLIITSGMLLHNFVFSLFFRSLQTPKKNTAKNRLNEAFCTGGIFTVQLSILADVAGVENVAKATGLFSMSIALGILVAVPLPGFIFDISQNYALPFYILGAIFVPAGVMLLCLAILRRTRWKNKNVVIET